MYPAWSRPLHERRGDWFFIAAFVVFALTSFGVDRLAALDVDFGGDGAYISLLRWYGENYDPLFLANPQWLRVMSGISAFVFGPTYLVFAYGFYRGYDGVRVPAIVLSTALLYSMVVHLWMEFFGELPAPYPGVLLAVYAPYAAVPIALLWRLRRARPFSA